MKALPANFYLACLASTFLIGSFLPEAAALNVTCYNCTSTNNGNTNCVDKPEALSGPEATARCDGYCTILRTEFTDIPGEVLELTRRCEVKPLVLNDVRTDKHYTKMYTACQAEKCNAGDGRREPGDSGGGSRGPNNIIIVTESDAHRTTTSILLLILTLWIVRLLK